MRPALLTLLLALTTLLGCSSRTDITRVDDDVEEWVEEQRKEDADRKAKGSPLPRPAPQTPERPQQPPPAEPESAPTQPAPQPDQPQPADPEGGEGEPEAQP